MSLRILKFFPVAALGLSLTACSYAAETIRGPELAPMTYPAELIPATQTVLPAPDASASPNSLWRAGGRSFFADQRARAVGDILTVVINIDDSASVTNSTNRDRSNGATAGVTSFFGLTELIDDLLPGSSGAANLVELESESNSAGSGVIQRSEQLELTIAAVVTAVMPNGNLVIQGRQEVRTNREVRELTVAGIVRPMDISARNTINHDQIAEARISYGGRGDISRVQATPAAQSLVERFSPF